MSVALKTEVMAVKKHFTINERNNILKYIKTYNTISLFYYVFNKINAALVSIRDFFQKHF